jgi:hypothetical protein
MVLRPLAGADHSVGTGVSAAIELPSQDLMARSWLTTEPQQLLKKNCFRQTAKFEACWTKKLPRPGFAAVKLALRAGKSLVFSDGFGGDLWIGNVGQVTEVASGLLGRRHWRRNLPCGA